MLIWKPRDWIQIRPLTEQNFTTYQYDYKRASKTVFLIYVAKWSFSHANEEMEPTQIIDPLFQSNCQSECIDYVKYTDSMKCTKSWRYLPFCEMTKITNWGNSCQGTMFRMKSNRKVENVWKIENLFRDERKCVSVTQSLRTQCNHLVKLLFTVSPHIPDRLLLFWNSFFLKSHIAQSWMFRVPSIVTSWFLFHLTTITTADIGCYPTWKSLMSRVMLEHFNI